MAVILIDAPTAVPASLRTIDVTETKSVESIKSASLVALSITVPAAVPALSQPAVTLKLVHDHTFV